MSSKKRKAVTRDVDEDPSVISGDEFELGPLDGAISESDVSASGGDSDQDDGSGFSDEDEESDFDGLDSDEIPSDFENQDGGLKPVSISVPINGAEKPARSLADDEEEDERPNFRVEKDANGNDRYVYDEIDPYDDSEVSETDENANAIGNIPLSFYDQYPHIGYNINGKKIMRPAKGEALDALLDSIEIPKGWTGLTDPSTGKPLELSREELELLRKVQMNEIPEEGYDPYPETVEYFTGKTEIMPLNAAPEPKRRFVPSKHEAKRVMKMVKAIREGRILPYKPPEEREEEDDEYQTFDVWQNEQASSGSLQHIPAPKLPEPSIEESYHPPPEYLPDDEEKKAWEDADEEDREREFLPRDHTALRKVPGYDRLVKEKFERCLDLYLAVRVRRNKLDIDPESLLPKLPSPRELRPFPVACDTTFKGHEGRARSVSVHPSGDWLASGGDDGTVRVWQLRAGSQVYKVKLSKEEPVSVVRWRPGMETAVLAAAVGDNVYVIIPPIVNFEAEAEAHELVDAGFGYDAPNATTNSTKSSRKLQWTRPPTSLTEQGVCVTLPLGHTAKTISWHRRGDYFLTVCPSASVPASRAIAIHTLSKHLTQYPFTKRLKGGGTPQTAQFHPSKPQLFIANQRVIRVYDLSRQSLLRILTPGARMISSFDVHPAGGDNLIVGTYDKRLLWHDLELSQRPYKTLRFHEKAIRAVRFHQGGRPLFADASDDGTVQVYHGSIVGDMMSNATIVPVKLLRGHTVTSGLGVLDLDWHPKEPWLVSAGSDGTCKMWM